MKILFLASEVAPWSKTGGLADVASALPAALARLGHDVRVVTPAYADVRRDGLVDAGVAVRVRFPYGEEGGPVLEARPLPGLVVHFLGSDALYGRPGIYGDAQSGEFPDNHRRYAYLCVGALQLCQRLGWVPDVLHANDWQTGLAPLALERGFRRTELARTRSVFTVHNLAYQGHFPKQVMPELGLPWDLFRMERGLEFYDGINLLKAGLEFADALTTVSPTYAHEIQTPEHGWALDGVLRRRARDLHGILNGVDVHEWDPTADPHLPAPFSADDLSGKARVKAALLEELGLAPSDAPLFGSVTRLAEQKGVDLMVEVLPRLLAQHGVRFVQLGSGEARYAEALQALQRRFPDQVRVRLGYDVGLSHRIEAGADFFLMPSRYEPCGLNQMYSMRYGTLPVVRETGGLADTVQEGPEGTGFLFSDFTPYALGSACERALALYARPDALKAMRQRGMRRDFSWERSARAYADLYASLAR